MSNGIKEQYEYEMCANPYDELTFASERYVEWLEGQIIDLRNELKEANESVDEMMSEKANDFIQSKFGLDTSIEDDFFTLERPELRRLLELYAKEKELKTNEHE